MFQQRFWRLFRNAATQKQFLRFNSVHLTLMTERIRIVFEDDHIVVVDKEADVLSVPGKSSVDWVDFVPRHEQWLESVATAASKEYLDPICKEVLIELKEYQSIPRKKGLFISFLQRACKINELSLREQVWDVVSKCDFERHKLAENKPPNLVSIAEILEHIYHKKVFHVHRLDMETSGILIFAKTDQAAGELCRQFRDREIQKTYIARVAGALPSNIDRVDVPIKPDLSNRPYQVITYLFSTTAVH